MLGHPSGLLAPKSLWSFNPIPRGCLIYAPLWHPALSGPVFKSADPKGHRITATGALWVPGGRDYDGGDDFLQLGVDVYGQVDFAAGLSMATWLKPERFDAADQYPINIEGRISLRIKGTTDKAEFQMYDGVDNIISGDGALSTATPYLILCSWDGTTMRLYVNGVQQSETKASSIGLLDAVNRNIAFGAAWGGDAVFYEGIQGDIWLYNRGLSEREGSYLYSRTRGRLK